MKTKLVFLFCFFVAFCSCSKIQYDIINGPTLNGSISEKEWTDIDITKGVWHLGPSSYVLGPSGRWEKSEPGDGNGVTYKFSDDSSVSITFPDKGETSKSDLVEDRHWSFDATSSILTIGQVKHKVIGTEVDKLYLDYEMKGEAIRTLVR